MHSAHDFIRPVHAHMCVCLSLCAVTGQYEPGADGDYLCSSKSTDSDITKRFAQSAHIILLIVVQESEEQHIR
jgi:hypothetical protein